MSKKKKKWKNRWQSPSRDNILSFEDVVRIIEKNKLHSIHIGTDSHLKKGTKGRHVFATVICLYEPGNGAFYYFSRETPQRIFKCLADRIMEEATRSLTLAQEIYVKFPNRKIVMHSDTNTDTRYPPLPNSHLLLGIGLHLSVLSLLLSPVLGLRLVLQTGMLNSNFT